MRTSLMTFVSTFASATTLEIQGSRFLVNQEATFLLGTSYYGGIGASGDFVDSDLRELKAHGFNWIRVWATWSAFGNNVSAVDAEGKAREPHLSQLRRLCEKADQLGMIVDVTLSRGNGIVGSGLLPSQEAHLNAVTILTGELRQFRNIYFDLANERNIRDRRHVTFEELRVLRNRIRELDAKRLVTASHAGDIPTEELRDYFIVVQVDFPSSPCFNFHLVKARLYKSAISSRAVRTSAWNCGRSTSRSTCSESGPKAWNCLISRASR